MRRLAIAASWLVLGMNLYGVLVLNRASAIGPIAMVPLLLLGMTLVVHHSMHMTPGAIWTALVLNVLWGLLGIFGFALMAFAGYGGLKMALFFALITLGPAIPNVLSLNSRRLQTASPRVAS
jgi:hypothetical protein